MSFIRNLPGGGGGGGAAVSPLSREEDGRVFRPLGQDTDVGSTLTLISGTAYFQYLGKVTASFLGNHVLFQVNGNGTGAQVGEVGLFTTALPPNLAGQNLTCVAATAIISDLTAGVQRTIAETLGYNTTVTDYLWVGIRTAMGGNQPTLYSSRSDLLLHGRHLRTVGAAAFAVNNVYAGVLPPTLSASGNGIQMALSVD